jgi:hypothetical protein
MSTGLLDALTLGEGALERQMAGVALIQPDLAADFTIMPEVDKGAKAFFERFYSRRKEIKAAEPKQAIKLALSCIPSAYDLQHFTLAIDDRYAEKEFITQELAAEIEQNLTALRAARKAAAWLEKSDLMRAIAKEGNYEKFK